MHAGYLVPICGLTDIGKGAPGWIFETLDVAKMQDKVCANTRFPALLQSRFLSLEHYWTKRWQAPSRLKFQVAKQERR